EADRRKDEFLAMLAHELRNPLGAISSASYILAHSGTGEGAAGRAVAIIQRQIQHLVRLVDDLLDVSRITRGKVELRREPLDLVEVVEQAVEMTGPVVDAKGHTLALSLPRSPVAVHGDATRLEQVVVNLIRNAATFTETGGRIAVTLRADAANGIASIAIADNGVGIAPDLMPRIFDLFAQGRQELDRSAGGLGIGLTLVRTLVELHGGRVEVESAGPGQGSEFRVFLPLAAADSLEATPALAVHAGEP
ncbi:MAG TPA: HAMP domain-containing sensor histidine kinase, partial [Thermoanaerobaculia bacterium]